MRRFALGHAKLLSTVSAQQRAGVGATSRYHDLNPAEAYGALAGKRSEPLRLGVRAHTHALCALKLQPKLSNGVAGFYRWRIIFGSAEIAAIPAISEMTNIRQECPGTNTNPQIE